MIRKDGSDVLGDRKYKMSRKTLSSALRLIRSPVGHMRMKKHISIILCGILSAVVLHTCIQIEVWNHLAGGNVLPSREGGKLRYSIGESEKGWRLYEAMRTQDESLKSGRHLTGEEQVLFRNQDTPNASDCRCAHCDQCAQHSVHAVPRVFQRLTKGMSNQGFQFIGSYAPKTELSCSAVRR